MNKQNYLLHLLQEVDCLLYKNLDQQKKYQDHIMYTHQQVENIIPLLLRLHLLLVLKNHLPKLLEIVDHQLNHSELKMRFRQLALNLLKKQCKDLEMLEVKNLSLKLKILSYSHLYFQNILEGKYMQNDHSHMTHCQLLHLDYDLKPLDQYNQIFQNHKNHHQL